MKVLFLTNYPSPYRVQFFNELGKLCNLTVLFEEGIEKQTHRNKNWFIEIYKFHFRTKCENYRLLIKGQ